MADPETKCVRNFKKTILQCETVIFDIAYPSGVTGKLKSMPTGGYTLDRSPLSHMSLDCGRKKQHMLSLHGKAF